MLCGYARLMMLAPTREAPITTPVQQYTVATSIYA
jgi:hypothetical protein